MKRIKRLSLTLTITLLFQLLVVISCDTTSSSSLTITNLSSVYDIIKPTETLSYSVGVEGATSTAITYHWQINDEAATETDINVFTFGPKPVGTYTLNVWATEGSNTSNTETAIIIVREEVIVIDKPKITASVDKKILSSAGDVVATINTTKSDWTYYFKLNTQAEQASSSNTKTISISSIGTYKIEMWVVDENDQKSNVVTIEVELIGSFPIHENVTASTFWCGEGATSDNNFITNTTSAWDVDWGSNFGLEDKPTGISRNSEHIPTSSKFTGNENPYYFALPYNDMGNLVYDGVGTKIENAVMGAYGRKQSAYDEVYWANEKTPAQWGGLTSMCKNRWIRVKIRWTNTWCYAQWEDAGPYYYEDYNYVFGSAEQLNDNNSPYAGIDLSPSIWLYLGKTLEWWGAAGQVDWQFVDEADVPDGPWKRHVTTKQIDWEKN